MKHRFYLIAFLLFLFLFSCQNQYSEKTQPIAIKGVLDLSDWDFINDGVVKLNGEWKFYWDQLLVPMDFEIQSTSKPMLQGYYNLPGQWNNYKINGEKLGSYGYATFRLKVIFPESSKRYALKLDEQSSAYTLWIDREKISQSGVVGKEKKLMVPQHSSDIVSVDLSQNIKLLTLNVSNYNHRLGGPWSYIEFGEERQIIQNMRQKLAFEMTLFGSIIIMAFYHFGLYILRKKDKSPLYFGFICLLICLRILIKGEDFLVSIYPTLNWEIARKVEYLTLYLIPPLWIAFVDSIFYRPFLRNRILPTVKVIGGIFALLTLVSTINFYSKFAFFYQIYFTLLCFYILFLLIGTSMKKEKGAIVIILGLILPVITFIHDILFIYQIPISPFRLVPLGTFLFILFQSFFLSLRFSKAYTKIEIYAETFQKFVPPNFMARIGKKGIESIKLGNAESAFISVLFSDIRSFTNFTENMKPKDVLDFLNAYFERLSRPIHKNRGFIDKFIGDAIMALFDLSEDGSEKEANCAVHAAIEMQDCLHEYNQKRLEYGAVPIKTGIGIHSGRVIIGTVGSNERMDSTVLGDVVNLAARLESLTKQYNVQIIISSATWALIKEDSSILWRKLDYVNVKGKDNPETIYEVFNSNETNIKTSKQQILKTYNNALDQYFSKNWDDSIKLFRECLEILPFDYASQIFLDRCINFKNNPPPANWNGAYTFLIK
ncbi:MAG: adenylate/guanylate cyclase domain-containing protein [Spirochaetaceae bacterium]